MKNLIKNYVFARKIQNEKEYEFESALKAFSTENQIYQLICSEYWDAIDAIILHLIGEKGVDWLGWWIYETDYGTKNALASDDTGNVTLDTFDKLWDFVILDKTAEEINNG